MKKRIFAIAIALVLFVSVCLVSACDNTKEPPVEELTARQQAFVDAVEAISTPITLTSGSAIDAAYSAYAFLDEYERDSETVKSMKATLDGYQSEYVALKGNNTEQKDPQQALIDEFIKAVAALPAVNDLTVDDRTAIDDAYVLYKQLSSVSKENADVTQAYSKLERANIRVQELEDTANMASWQQTADEFISAVANLDEITLESGEVISDLLYQYDNFPDGVKNIGGMAEAKEVLDQKYAQYQGIKDLNDVKEFISAVSAIGQVTLDSESAIRKAESIYEYMSDNAKSKDNVVAAYETLASARAKYDELFAVVEAERVANFISIANRIPTNLDNVDITWYDILSQARDAYFAMTFESMSLPEVEEAFARWDAAQTAFDNKGYKQLPNFSVNIVYSGDAVPYIVMQLFVEQTAVVREFYGVSTNVQLQQYATLYLDVYVDGVYVTKTAIDMNPDKLELGFILKGVDNILKGLSSTNLQITSGANFSFAVHIEDKSNNCIPTEKTKLSNSYNYTW